MIIVSDYRNIWFELCEPFLDRFISAEQRTPRFRLLLAFIIGSAN